MATRAQIAEAANRHRDAEHSSAPTLKASSPKKVLLDWISYLDDSGAGGDMHIDDAWATVRANVGRYIQPPGKKLTLGRLV